MRWLLVAVATVYVLLCAALFFLQRRLIYFPQPRSAVNGGATLVLPVPGQRVLVSTRPAAGRNAVVYFGGNAEDVSLNMPDFSNAFPDRAIYLLHYRGYGESSGTPTEANLFADALTLFDEVHNGHPDVQVIGRSLGSGVALYVASRRPVARLVLVTPYDSLVDVAVSHFPWVPVRWLMRDRFESWKYAPRVNVPVLIVAAEHDEVVPRASTEMLLSRFRRGRASIVVLPGTGHNTISDNPRYMGLLRESQ
ncbi:MAG TPA: alpha/beta fold hydrolase [Bryobacteraceae bacterium]|nr:alpha/beta fold hydrolase [Bryobacteraceae bacterium]